MGSSRASSTGAGPSAEALVDCCLICSLCSYWHGRLSNAPVACCVFCAGSRACFDTHLIRARGNAYGPCVAPVACGPLYGSLHGMSRPALLWAPVVPLQYE